MKRLSPIISFILLFILLSVLIFVPAFNAFAKEIEISAVVDKTSISVNESIDLTVTISGGKGSVDVFCIQDFTVISHGTSTRLQIINGQASKETSYNYTLTPKRDGDLIVPPLPVSTDKGIFNTKVITIRVSQKPIEHRDGNDVIVSSDVSEQNPYNGQQITYTFTLKNAVQIHEAKFQKPEFSGFSSKEIERKEPYRTVISGREYIVTQITYILVPLKTGKKIIEPAVIECNIVRRIKRGRGSSFDSFFNDTFFNRAQLETKVFKTSPLTVNVKPLPKYSSDIKFSGLVGNFKLKAELENNTLCVGDSTTLSVIIDGTGNIMDAQKPEMIIPDRFKVYEDSPEKNVTADKTGFSGKKVFRLALVAIQQGTFTIEPVRLVYFDVDRGKYKTISSSPFSINVIESAKKEVLNLFSAAPGSLEPQNSLKQKVKFTGRDILQLKEDIDSLENKKPLPLYVFILFLAVPMAFCLVLKIYFVFMPAGKNAGPAAVMAKRSENALKKADKIKDNNVSVDEFFSCLYKAVVFSIFSRAGVKGESLTYKEAQNFLGTSGFSDETAKQAAVLLEKIESARYSGLNVDKAFKESLLAEIKQMTRSLSR